MNEIEESRYCCGIVVFGMIVVTILVIILPLVANYVK